MLRALLNQIISASSKAGPYRYLVKRWDDISDIELAKNVLAVDPFIKELSPLPFSWERIKSVLVFAPHQDDEIIGLGGLLAMAVNKNIKINIVYVTDGAPKNKSDSARVESIVNIRNKEAEKVCSQLKANVFRLNISNIKPEPKLQDLDRIHTIFEESCPDITFVPWLLDSPAKHRMVSHLLYLANKVKNIPESEVYGYQVHNTLLPNVYLDITSYMNKKEELLKIYESQNKHTFNYIHTTRGLNAWNSRFIKENLEEKYIETFMTLPTREYFSLIEKFYFSDFIKTYRGDSSVLPGMQSIHKKVIANG